MALIYSIPLNSNKKSPRNNICFRGDCGIKGIFLYSDCPTVRRLVAFGDSRLFFPFQIFVFLFKTVLVHQPAGEFSHIEQAYHQIAYEKGYARHERDTDNGGKVAVQQIVGHLYENEVAQVNTEGRGCQA